MINIRKILKDKFIIESGIYDGGYYKLLKDCLITSDDVNKIDVWFEGIVKSIVNYQPNTKLLVLTGHQGVGKSVFLRNIFPDDLDVLFCEVNEPKVDLIYNKVIIDCHVGKNFIRDILPSKNPITFYSNGVFTCDKRLASYCTTWSAPLEFKNTRRLIMINVNKIDWELYNSIDKTKLWIEIFQKFK